MIQVTRTELLPGVYLTAVHTQKFKSSQLGVTLLTGLDREDAALNALLPSVLCRGSMQHPDIRAVARELDELYGGTVSAAVSKKGEVQCVGLTASFLDDAFAPEGEPILRRAAGLLGELLLQPRMERGAFCAEYVRSERANLIDRIRAQMNDRRKYALLRLGQEMCPDEAFGVDVLGDEARAAAVTPESLWAQDQALLGAAPIELYYSGSADAEQAARALRAAFDGLPAAGRCARPATAVRAEAPGQVRTVTQQMEVSQGKLALGFRTGGIRAGDPRFPALVLLNAVYGGTSMSKLFMNVREKLSLCYYASSTVEKWKGLMLVSSGIEFDKYDQARQEILAQLDACRRGEITADELEGARRIVVTGYRTMMDSQKRLADFWLGQAAGGQTAGPEALAEQIERVTLDQVVEAAEAIRLDTVYFLTGKGAAQ